MCGLSGSVFRPVESGLAGDLYTCAHLRKGNISNLGVFHLCMDEKKNRDHTRLLGFSQVRDPFLKTYTPKP